MKLSRILPIVGAFGLIFLLNRYLPTEEEREKDKLSELVNRNELEKLLVGKWNHSDFPAGLENDRNYHLLGADASYSYRGSDKSKTFGGSWSISMNDSVLSINRSAPNSSSYKILEIAQGHIRLQKIENDSLARKIAWFRHP